MRDGYGIVAASVEKATMVKTGDSTGSRAPVYVVQFKVDDILAQPCGGHIPAKKGGKIELRLTVGYLGQIGPVEPLDLTTDEEKPVLETGMKFLLTIRYNKKNGVYEHAPGASAAQRIKRVTDEDKAFYGKVREIVALSESKSQVKEWRRLVVEAKPKSKLDARLRSVALDWLISRAIAHTSNTRHEPSKAARSEMKAELNGTFNALAAVWRKTTSSDDTSQLAKLDYCLAETRPAYKDSAERLDIWLRHLFGPIRAQGPGDVEHVVWSRCVQGSRILRDLRQRHSKFMGPFLVHELGSKNWPMSFRVHIAYELHTLYEYEILADPRVVDRALQSFYPGAIESANASDLRTLLFPFSKLSEDRNRLRLRVFRPTFAFEQLLGRALKRMQADGKKGDFNREAAILDLKELLEELKEAKKGKK
jgi:hypothetical protein